MEEEFKFLVMKNPENGLIFVSLDSMVGYLRHLSRAMDSISWRTEDSAGTDMIAKAFSLLSDKLEEMQEDNS